MLKGVGSISKILVWLIQIVEWFLGIQFKHENLNLKFDNLSSVAVILTLTTLIVIYTPLLQTMDTMVLSLNTEWIYQWALSGFKFSFITTPIHLSIICLFKNVRNPLTKFKNTFALLMIGFIGAYVLVYLMQTMPKTIPSETLGILWLYPLITVAIVRLSISQEIKR